MTRRSVALALCLAAVTTTGCASRSRPPANEPSPATDTYRGFATYYGPGFAGELTASGTVFNPREMVAAHRSLPFGTRVRVTNLSNGRSVVLTIVDRGPYSGRGNIIDVSQGAARKLDFIRRGRVPVKVEVLSGSR